MLPVLVAIGPFRLYSFGVMLFVGFFMAMFLIWKRGRELYFEESELFDAVFFVLLWMLILGRVGYVIYRFESYGWNVLAWLNLLGKPGLMVMSAFIGGMGAAFYQAKMRKWDFFSLGDVLVVGLALGQTVVALGAFLNGSGYGVVTTSFVGIIFPGMFEKRHPLQLYEFLAYGGLFCLLWKLEEMYRTLSWYRGGKSEARSGFVTAVYFMGYGLFGLLTSSLRVGTDLGGVRLDTFYYLALALLGILVLSRRSGTNVWDLMLTQVGTMFRVTWKDKLNHLTSRKERRRVRRNLGKDIFS